VEEYLIHAGTSIRNPLPGQVHSELTHGKKDAQMNTENSPHFLERLTETSPDLLFVYDLYEHRSVYINGMLASTMGYTKEQLQAMIDPAAHVVHPEDLAGVRNWFAEFDTVADRHVQNLEIRARHANGSYRWILVRASIFERTPDGRAKQILGICTDVTVRKLHEVSLLESEERLSLALKAGGMGMWEWNLLTNDVLWSPGLEAIHGIAPGTFEGTFSAYQKDIHPDDHEVVLRAIQKTVEQGSDHHIEYRIIWPDGSVHWVEGRGKLFREQAGMPVRMIGVCMDITQRKQGEGELRRWRDELEFRVEERTRELLDTQDRLRSLASQLSLTEERERRKLANDLHDHLAQLLVVGSMKLDQVKKVVTLSPEGDGLIRDLEAILQQALLYSRTMIAELSPPALRKAGLLTSLRWLAQHMQKHGLCVTVQSDPEQDQIPEDRVILLFQSVRELLFNVLKHAGVDQAMIRVNADSNGNVCISVEDSGKGVDVNPIQHTLKPGHMGLFAVQERMGAMGGRMEFTSVPGHGTTVKLELPVGHLCAGSLERERPDTVWPGNSWSQT
jgi:PAS domain S-box-containing protein